MKRTLEEVSSDIRVTLNAGGTLYQTRLSTLQKSLNHFPDSVLGRIFTDTDWRKECGPDQDYFLDMDPRLMRHVLTVLRMPVLAEVTPKDIEPIVWKEILDFWGLTNEGLVSRHKKRAFEKKSTLTLAEEMRREIHENEETIVRIILEESGFYASKNKSRHIEIYVPVEKYALPWDDDLGLYFKKESNRDTMIRKLQRMFNTNMVVISQLKHRTEPHHYTFAGKEYNTNECSTFMIELTLGDDSINFT